MISETNILKHNSALQVKTHLKELYKHLYQIDKKKILSYIVLLANCDLIGSNYIQNILNAF